LGDADRGQVEEPPKWSALANPARGGVAATDGVGEQDSSPDFSRGFVGGWVLIRESACPAVQDRLV